MNHLRALVRRHMLLFVDRSDDLPSFIVPSIPSSFSKSSFGSDLKCGWTVVNVSMIHSPCSGDHSRILLNSGMVSCGLKEAKSQEMLAYRIFSNTHSLYCGLKVRLEIVRLKANHAAPDKFSLKSAFNSGKLLCSFILQRQIFESQ